MLMIAVIGIIRSSIYCLRRRVGNGSTSHEAFVDFRMILRTSLVVVCNRQLDNYTTELMCQPNYLGRFDKI